MRDKSKIKPNRWAYLGGIVDGDGSFTIRYADGYYQSTLNVYGTSRPLMKWLVRVFGSSWRKMPTSGNRKQKYTWYTSNPEIVQHLTPYLVLKQQQAIIVQQFFALGSERNPQAREELMNDLQRANQAFVPVSKAAITELKKNSTAPTKLDYAYLAGLFDAEGSFSIHKRKQRGTGAYTSAARISNTDMHIFPWLASRFGGVVSFSKHKDHRNEGTWCLSEPRGLVGRKQREVKLLAILPYLVAKRERAILLLEWIRTNGDMTLDEKHEYYLRMKALNKRGISPEANIPRPSETEDMIESDPGSDVRCAPAVTLVA